MEDRDGRCRTTPPHAGKADTANGEKSSWSGGWVRLASKRPAANRFIILASAAPDVGGPDLEDVEKET